MISRQELFSRNTPALEPVGHDLYATPVGIVGAGGLGSNLAVFLARMGFTALIIADFDIVSPSNCNRQQYLAAQIGQPKTVALKANLEQMLPGLDIGAVQQRIDGGNVRAHFSECGVLADCTDTAGNKSSVVEAGLSRLTVPVVTASGVGGRTTAGMLRVRKRFNSRLWVVGDGSSHERKGVIAPAVAAVSAIMAEAVYALCKDGVDADIL